MLARDGVLLMTTDAETTSAVTAALAPSGRFYVAGACRNVPELARQLANAETSVALVDVGSDPVRTVLEMEPVIARFPDKRFLLLTRTLGNDLLLEAMQAGARHCLLKEAIARGLVGALQRLLPDGAQRQSERGSVVTVLSSSGGCGATTVACNLANEMGLERARPALLIDLDNAYGAAGAYLGVHGRYGIADVLAHDGGIDAHLVRSTAVVYSASLHLLLSPAGIQFAQPAPLRLESFDRLFDACRQAYPCTVVDAPRAPVATAALLARASDVILIVFQLTVKDIQMARTLRAALIEAGIPPERLEPVVNRYRRWSYVSLREAEKVLENRSLHLVRNDFPRAVRGMNYGQLLAQTASTSGLRHDIRQLAATLRLVQPSAKTGAEA